MSVNKLIPYKNEKFDKLYEQAIEELDRTERYKLLLEAEKNVVEDIPLIPLYYSETFALLQSRVKGFYSNGTSYRDFAWVWIKEEPKESSEKKPVN